MSRGGREEKIVCCGGWQGFIAHTSLLMYCAISYLAPKLASNLLPMNIEGYKACICNPAYVPHLFNGVFLHRLGRCAKNPISQKCMSFNLYNWATEVVAGMLHIPTSMACCCISSVLKTERQCKCTA